MVDTDVSLVVIGLDFKHTLDKAAAAEGTAAAPKEVKSDADVDGDDESIGKRENEKMLVSIASATPGGAVLSAGLERPTTVLTHFFA